MVSNWGKESCKLFEMKDWLFRTVGSCFHSRGDVALADEYLRPEKSMIFNI